MFDVSARARIGTGRAWVMSMWQITIKYLSGETSVVDGFGTYQGASAYRDRLVAEDVKNTIEYAIVEPV